jgi:hypothetical protein
MPEPAGTSAASFEEVADELYGLAPPEFTAARTQHEKVARRAKDRELADSIHALRKPSVTAWLANQLVREHRDELQPLLELGAGLRAATQQLAGDQLRELSRQQHALVYALVQRAREVARPAGQPVSPDTATGLEETLRAALADEGAAELLLRGRLTEALHYSGFGEPTSAETRPDLRIVAAPAQRPTRRSGQKSGGDGKSAGDQKSAEDEKARADREARAAELAHADQDLATSKRVFAEAAQARDDARAQLTAADDAVQEATDEVSLLRERLEQASAAAAQAGRVHRERAKTLERAERAARDADQRRGKAEAHRDRLAGGR